MLPVVSPTEIPETAQPAMPERRYLTLEFPPKIRAGDSDIVRLTLEVDDKGNIVPTAEIEGNVVKGQVIEIPNLYETHHVIAEARFDIAGVEVRPTRIDQRAAHAGNICCILLEHPSDRSWQISRHDLALSALCG